MASRRWLRGQSDVMVSLSMPPPLTTLGASRSTGPFDEVRRVYEDFATALRVPLSLLARILTGGITTSHPGVSPGPRQSLRGRGLSWADEGGTGRVMV